MDRQEIVRLLISTAPRLVESIEQVIDSLCIRVRLEDATAVVWVALLQFPRDNGVDGRAGHDADVTPLRNATGEAPGGDANPHPTLDNGRTVGAINFTVRHGLRCNT